MALTKVSSGLISADASSVDLNIDAGTLYIDATNNRVGIGNTSPDKLLHLAAGTGATLRLESTTTGATTGDIFGAIEFETQDSNSAGVKGKIDSYSEGAVGNGALRFFTGNTTELGERMRIDSSGNVGINTTNPDYILNTNYNAPATFTNAASDFTQMWQNSGTNALGVALSDDLVARLVTNNSYEFAIGSSTTEQLRIDGGGRVGIGTDNPSVRLHVFSSTEETIRVDGDAGKQAIHFRENGTLRGIVGFSDGSAISTSLSDNDFAVRSDSNLGFCTGGANLRMLIDSGGALLLGTTSATSSATFETITANKMHVQGGTSGETSPIVHLSDSDGTVEGGSTILSIGFDNDSSFSNANYIRFIDQTAEQGVIEGAGAGSVTYTTSSDKRRKENIEDAPNYLEKIKQIGVKKYNFIGSEKKEVGMLAQDLYEIIPEPVKVGGDDENSNPWGIDYGKLTPFLIKAIQEQQEQIESLKSEIELLKGGQ